MPKDMEKTTETYQYTKLSYFMLGFLIVAAFFGIVGGIDLVASAESETSKVLGWLAIVILYMRFEKKKHNTLPYTTP